MKTFAYLGLAGFALSVSSALLTTSNADHARWERVPHQPLFKTVSGALPVITASPDVAMAIQGVDAMPAPGTACCQQVADAIAY